ncbi:unnamed protein product [Rhodiola kirilowii]
MMHKSLFVSAQSESALCMSLDLDNGTAFSAVQIPMRYLSALYSLFKRAKMFMPHSPCAFNPQQCHSYQQPLCTLPKVRIGHFKVQRTQQRQKQQQSETNNQHQSQ